ncbi:pirin domain-containing protein [Clavulina sp. PMI_390]|nr:pirin domain-containing protein [Clavulina sp. PMI_390]
MSTATNAAEKSSATTLKLTPRLSQDRGHADITWLKTFHTFSFSSYWDPKFAGFGGLRVINEDRVQPSRGFGQHRHSEMEIFSYIVSGELEHKDSMGNREIMKRGDVQMTSAGTGIAHSEFNANSKHPVHFLQIWVNPGTYRLEPSYYTRHFTDAEKRDVLVQVVGPIGSSPEVLTEREGSGPTPIHANTSVFASLLSPSVTVSHSIPSPKEGESERKTYVHLIQTSGYNTEAAIGAKIRINGEVEISEGDGVFVTSQGATENLVIENVSDRDAEFLVFDVAE